MERKSSKEYSVVFMVEGEKFKLRNLPSRTSSLLCPAVNSGGTLLEFAALDSCPGDKYSRASAFCPQPWFLWWSEHISQEQHPHIYQSSCDR